MKSSLSGYKHYVISDQKGLLFYKVLKSDETAGCYKYTWYIKIESRIQWTKIVQVLS